MININLNRCQIVYTPLYGAIAHATNRVFGPRVSHAFVLPGLRPCVANLCCTDVAPLLIIGSLWFFMIPMIVNHSKNQSKVIPRPS